MANITKRINNDGSTVYKARVRLKGYPQQTATFKKLTDARKWAANTEVAIREGRHFKTAEARKHTLSDALTWYHENALIKFTPKEQQNRTKILSWWGCQLGSYILADLTSALFAQCRDTLLKTPSPRKKGSSLSAATVKKYFLVINDVLNRCITDTAWLNENPLKSKPIKMPPEEKGRSRYLNDDERILILKACKESKSPYLFTCLVLAISTGMRKGELTNLYWVAPKKLPATTAYGVVDLDTASILLHQTKNNESRRVALAGLALQLIRDLKQPDSNVSKLFPSLLFPSIQDPSKPFDFRSAWETARKRAGLEDYRWHDNRHTFASYLAMNGASLIELSESTGHKNLEMVKRYAHLSDAHTSTIVAEMNAKVFGGKK